MDPNHVEWSQDTDFQFLYYHVHEFSGPVGWGEDTVSSARPWNAPRTYAVSIFSTINGYHAYRFKPPVGLPLQLVAEVDNPVDRHAFRVQVSPELEMGLLSLYPGVADVRGKCVGHVPKELAAIMNQGIERGWMKSMTVFHTGGMVHHGPVRGGGPKLCACYLCNVTDRTHLVNLLRGYGIPSDSVFF